MVGLLARGLERGGARPPSAGEESAALVSCGEVLGVQEVRVVGRARELGTTRARGRLWVRGPSAEGTGGEETGRDFSRLAGSDEAPSCAQAT